MQLNHLFNLINRLKLILTRRILTTQTYRLEERLKRSTSGGKSLMFMPQKRKW